MSKLRCYERNNGRDGIINLVKYSRKLRKGNSAVADNSISKEISLREIRAEHYNQSRSYIERIQAHIPGETVRKIASIREQIKIL